MKVLLLAMLALPAAAQVQVMYSPMDSTVSGLWGPRNGVYVWNIMVVNQSSSPAKISPETIAMSAPVLIPFMTADQGLALFTAKIGSSKKEKVVKGIGYATLGAAAIGGFGAFQVSAKVISSLAAGSGVARQLGDKIAAGESPRGPIVARVLNAPVALQPGGSDTWVMFAGQMKAAAAQKVTLDASILR